MMPSVCLGGTRMCLCLRTCISFWGFVVHGQASYRVRRADAVGSEAVRSTRLNSESSQFTPDFAPQTPASG
ncbi:hypothetical protein DFH06DRAFT_1234940 [Mycena polygramma]|nr:hypothetical protein DFH06DRAFT_1234940 [Mycena polygramma]